MCTKKTLDILMELLIDTIDPQFNAQRKWWRYLWLQKTAIEISRETNQAS